MDTATFYWKENNNLIHFLACHVEDMIWGGNQYFKDNIIKNLKKNLTLGPEEIETFTYTGIEIKQNLDQYQCHN